MSPDQHALGKMAKPLLALKGHWLPVLLEDEDGCSELFIRCAGAVA